VKLLAVAVMVAAGVGLLFLPGLGGPAVPPVSAAPVPKDEAGKKKPEEKAEPRPDDVDAQWALLASTDDLVAGRAMLNIRFVAKEKFFADKLKPLTLTEDRAKELLADLGSDDEKTWKAAYEELSYLDPRLALSVPGVVKDSKGQAHDERLAALLYCRPPAEAEVFKWCKITVKINPAPPKPGTPVPVQLVIANHPDKPDAFKTILDDKGVLSGWSMPVAADVASLNAGYGQLGSWRRAVRAVAVLEHLGTPAAKKILEDMATGHADAAPTKAAKAALEHRKTWP
jgi:hypothetical protein